MNKLEEFKRFIDATLANDGNPNKYTVYVRSENYNKSGDLKRTEIQFWGWALVLLPDGTWYCLDTSGG